MDINKVLTDIEYGNTSLALDNLKILFNNDQDALKDVIMLKSKYAFIQQHYSLGLIKHDEYLSEISKINYAIIYYIFPKYQNYQSETKIPFSIKIIQTLTDTLKYTKSQNLQFTSVHLLYQLLKDEYGLLRQTLNTIESNLGDSIYKNIGYYIEHKQQKTNGDDKEINWLDMDYIQFAIQYALKYNKIEVNEGDLILGLFTSIESNTITLLKRKYPAQINLLIALMSNNTNNQTDISLEDL